MSLTSHLSARFPTAYGRWAALPSRDRRALGAALALVLVLVVWSLAWRPMVRDIATMRAAVPRENSALAEGQQLAEEVAGLARAPNAPRSDEPRVALERILASSGLRSAVTQLEWQEGRARVVLAAVAFDRLVGALETLQRDGRLRVVEAVVTARIEPGSVRAEITLAP